jgi:DNA-binding beta-propeller fold protein YncE
MRPILLSAVLSLSLSAIAAETPSGLVEQVIPDAAGATVVLHFDAQAASHLLPGEMLALYAPGVVEKHPLTGQIIVARPVLAAKAQLTEVIGRLAGRVRWTATGAKILPGMDAIPLPAENAPNAPPALTAAPARSQVAAGSIGAVQVPVADQDKDPLAGLWTLEGPKGRQGRLLARTTGGIANHWLAPLAGDGEIGSAEITAVARISDPLGQEVTVRIPLVAAAPGSVSGRTLVPLATWGVGQDPTLVRLARDASGSWWGLGDNGQPYRIAPGWLTAEGLALAQDQLPKRAVGLAIRGDELHILDAQRSEITVIGTDSTVRRHYGRFDKPTALALAPNGTAFVADQAAGGIEIMEPDGSYRGRLGRSGPGAADWQGLVAVACDRAGDLFALDQVRHTVTHYDRFQRRVEEWAVPADPKDPPVDLAVHPQRGVLVLFATGRLIAVSAAGATEVARPLLTAGIDPGSARAIAIDQRGEVITCHSERGGLVRYDSDLHCTGVRAERAHDQTLWAADGSGTSYGLDQDTGLVTVWDGEGWAVNRLDAEAKGGGLFGSTLALTVDPTGSHLWVVDSKKHGLHRLELGSTTLSGFIGSEGSNNGQFDEPVAVASDEAGRIYVIDAGQYRVQVLDANGGFLFSFGTRGKGAAEFHDPERIAVAPAGDACYVYDSWSNEIKKFTLDQRLKSAKHVTNGGGKGSNPGQLRKVVGLGCDRRGLLYVLDASRDDLQVFDFRGDSCVTLSGTALATLGTSKATALAVTPDGQVGLHGNGRATWFTW